MFCPRENPLLTVLAQERRDFEALFLRRSGRLAALRIKVATRAFGG
jgi:hypothetical protein